MLLAILFKFLFFIFLMFLLFVFFWVLVVSKVIGKMKKFATTQNGTVFQRHYGTGESPYQGQGNNQNQTQAQAQAQKDVEVEYKVVSK
jgi:hypothetical protein